ncbi:MAG: kynureninase [Legionellaceae bacterium]|nr:kynureninase [Legionellaceae bacterium]
MKQSAFMLPAHQVYLCGHSLGPKTQAAHQKLTQALLDWGQDGVGAWNQKDWLQLPHVLSARIARLIGAENDEVMVGDSTSVNFFKALHSACTLNPNRRLMVTDADNFPSDVYVAEGLADMYPDLHLQRVTSDTVLDALNETVGVLLLTHVNYRTAHAYNMDEVTQKAKSLGILVVWDLSHSTGILPVNLGACAADFAVGCTYKYLNGGPGAPGFIYVNRQHHRALKSPILGWMGHQARFAFEKHYQCVPNATQYLIGTPAILSLKALEGALDVYDGLAMQSVRQKSMALTEYMRKAIAAQVPSLVLQSPSNVVHRGGHLAYTHPDAYAISKALIKRGVICDYRAPHLLRFCPNPLYVSVSDITHSVRCIAEVVSKKQYDASVYQSVVEVT